MASELGPRVRINQEHADELWFLKVCDSREDASILGGVLRGRVRPADGAVPRRRAEPRDGRGAARAALRHARHRIARQGAHGRLRPPPRVPARWPGGGRRRADAEPDDVRRRAANRLRIDHHRCSGARTGRRSPSGSKPPGCRCVRASTRALRFETMRKDYVEAVELARPRGRCRRPDHQPARTDRRSVWSFMPLAHLRQGMTVLVEDGDAEPRAQSGSLGSTPLSTTGRCTTSRSTARTPLWRTMSACRTASTSSGVRT